MHIVDIVISMVQDYVNPTIKKVRIREEGFVPFEAYRTPETRANDSKYDPRDLWDRVKDGFTQWNFVGEAGVEQTLREMLYLSAQVQYFFAVTESKFIGSRSIRGYEEALERGKVAVTEVPDIGKLVRISEEALDHAQRI